MKFIFSKRQRGESGSVLVFTVIVVAMVGITLASYLTLVRSQNMVNHRSQAWNATVAVIEAGVEDALTHLNRNGDSTLVMDGWQRSGDIYWVRRALSPDSYYFVTISNYTGPGSLNPMVRSIGYVKMPIQVVSSSQILFAHSAQNVTTQGFMSRGVRVEAGRDAFTRKAMVAKGQIDFNGNNFATDSFDSSDPAYSTGGIYDPAKSKDNGDVATNSDLVNSVNVGNAKIKGKVSTGPGGSIAIGAGGSAGSESWVNSGATGIEPGWSTDDMNVDFPNVEAPFTGGAYAPSPGVVGGLAYTYVLGDGNYQMSSLSMNGTQAMLVQGDAVLYIPGNVMMSGSANISVAPGASLQIYVGGATANFGGSGIVNTSGKAENLSLYGLPSNTSLALAGSGDFTGVIYAPSADLSLSGGGSTVHDFVGASISKSVTLNGSYSFHFDEDLMNTGPFRGYTVRSWNEMTPSEVLVLREQSGSSGNDDPYDG